MSFRLLLILLLTLLLSGCARLFLDGEEYLIKETEHFIFYYKEGSRVAADIERIAELSQGAVEWQEQTQGFKIDIKAEAYLYDSGKDTAYYKTVKGLENDSTSELKGGFQICYDAQQFDNEKTARVILHEFLHVVQQHQLYLFNIAISEGHAYYYEFKYYVTYKVGSCPEKKLIDYFKGPVVEGLKAGDYPTRLFAMDFQQFQKFDYINLNRDPGQRYKIAASFIAFLVMRYGADPLNSWLRVTENTNYSEAFQKVYPISLREAQSEWLLLHEE